MATTNRPKGASLVVYCGDCMRRFTGATPQHAADLLREHIELDFCPGKRYERGR